MESNKITRITIMLMILTLLARISGFMRELVLSYAYGASAMSDAYIVGTSFSTVLFAGIAAAFLNAYISVAAGKNDNVTLSKFTSNVFNISSIITILISTLLLVFLKPLMNIFAVGFKGETFDNAMIIATFAIGVSICLIISNVMIGFLQIKGKFMASALQSMLSNAVVCMTILLAAGSAVKLGMGYALSIIFPAVILIIIACMNGYKYSIHTDIRDKDLHMTIKICIPIFVGQLAMQFNSFIDRSFASTLQEGTVSSLKYGALLCNFVVSIFAVSIATVIYPKLSEYAQQKKETQMSDILISTLRTIVLIVTPLIVGAILLSTPIIKLLFERGAFESNDTMMTSQALALYAFSILGNSFSEILNRAFFANKDSVTPITHYTLSMGLNIVLNAVLIQKFGARGLAFATTVSSLLSMVLLIKAYKRKNKQWDIKKIINSLMVATVGAIVMILTICMTNLMFPSMAQNSLFEKLIALGLPASLGVLSYILVLFLLNVPETNTIKKYFFNR